MEAIELAEASFAPDAGERATPEGQDGQATCEGHLEPIEQTGGPCTCASG